MNRNPINRAPPPVPRKKLRKLKPKKISKNVLKKIKKNDCPICKDVFVEKEYCLKLPCDHYFHNKCVKKWLRMHNSCPICRKKID